MTDKPSYDELEQRIRELEAELEDLRHARERSSRKENRMREAEQMALIGHWELDLPTNVLYWSDEIYRIFELSPDEFGATYEAFLRAIHPDDREFVNHAYNSSLKNRTGYDIVHRLLMGNGRIKYVNEKCRTEFDDEGNPLRSLGTVQDITERMRAEHTFCGMIGRDVRMQETFETIRDLAAAKVPVLIQGESGTGKELVAQAIHQQSPRATGPFVPVNCGALPEGLLESELFGHVKGAFTGAIRSKKGRFELADGGTLFLDEVADMPKLLQVKLLRVLQEGTFERVGDEKTRQVDVRIISAANRDLAQEVKLGNFREDLYYRVKVMPILLPPLRDRRTDIPLLAEHFLERTGKEGYQTEGISREAVARLMDFSWPGNVRELQSVIHYALIKSRGKLILPEHLPPDLRSEAARPDVLAGQNYPTREPQDPSPPRKGRVSKLDRDTVERAIARTHGNKLKAAKLLGIGRATLYRYLNKNPL